MKKIILSIDGMTCSACSNGLEKYLNKQKGISNAVVNLVMANATIEYDETLLEQAEIEEFVKQAGFKSLGEFKEIKTEKKSKKEKIKFIIFTILAVVLMYISMGHMVNLPTIEIVNPHTNPINYTVCLLILTILFIIYGYDILKNGYKNLIHKTPNMDTLVGVGVMSSFLYSLYSMYMIIKGNYSYTMNLYFESTSIVIYFIKLGRYIDGISKNKTKEAIQKLVKITPDRTVIKIGGVEKQVTLDEIHKGDIVISRPGEKIAVDGEIILGKAHFDESFITGESKPIAKEEGNKVIAVITFFIYLAIGQSFGIALSTFVTILVVACPCSLGLATPLAIVVSEGLCASNGIIVKKSEILENSEKVNTIVFDKTGTLTYGKLKISEIFNYSNMKGKDLLQLVCSIEGKSTHPIGKAFTDYMKDNNIETLNVEEFENVAGFGIIGKVKNERIILGNSKILAKYKIQNTYLEDEKKLAEKGNSIVYVVKNNKIVALIGVNDIVRKSAKEVIDILNKNKIQTIMLTGDNKETAEKIAKDIGITKVISNVLPSEKAEAIKGLKQENRYVMMCGDVINDSPALASSDIGVSLNTGTDIAMDSSDVILAKDDLGSIINLIQISNKTIRNIKQDLFWAFFYNMLMIPVAAGIFRPIGISINPMIASIAMVLSSITVILNALRLRNIKIDK